MIRKKLFPTTALATWLILAFWPIASHAALIPSNCLTQASGNVCSLNDLAQLFVNLYTVGIAYVGGIALVFMVIGGFVLLTSGGQQERVALGKKILTTTVVGIAIVMTAYLIINIIQTQFLGVKTEFLLTSSSDCRGKADGTPCSLVTQGGTTSQNVYTCIEEICMPTHQCKYQTDKEWKELDPEIKELNQEWGGIYNKVVTRYDFSDGNSDPHEYLVHVWKDCRDKSGCDENSIQTGLCPGGNDIVCCYPKYW